MCIKEGVPRFSLDLNEYIQPLNLQVGSPYTVVDMNNYYGLILYELAEFPPDPDINWFGSYLFVKISDESDEIETEEQELVEAL